MNHICAMFFSSLYFWCLEGASKVKSTQETKYSVYSCVRSWNLNEGWRKRKLIKLSLLYFPQYSVFPLEKLKVQCYRNTLYALCLTTKQTLTVQYGKHLLGVLVFHDTVWLNMWPSALASITHRSTKPHKLPPICASNNPFKGSITGFSVFLLSSPRFNTT